MSSCISLLFRPFSQGSELTSYERLKKYDVSTPEINYHDQIIEKVRQCSSKLPTMSEKEISISAKTIRDAFVRNVKSLGNDPILDKEATEIFNNCIKKSSCFGRIFFQMFENIDKEMQDTVPQAKASMSRYCWIFSGY